MCAASANYQYLIPALFGFCETIGQAISYSLELLTPFQSPNLLNRIIVQIQFSQLLERAQIFSAHTCQQILTKT